MELEGLLGIWYLSKEEETRLGDKKKSILAKNQLVHMERTSLAESRMFYQVNEPQILKLITETEGLPEEEYASKQIEIGIKYIRFKAIQFFETSVSPFHSGFGEKLKDFFESHKDKREIPRSFFQFRVRLSESSGPFQNDHH